MTVTSAPAATERFGDRGGSCGTEAVGIHLSVRHSQVDGLGRGHCLLNPPSLPPQDYGSALRGLCEDTLEGLLFLLLFSLLSAGALAFVLCSLPELGPSSHPGQEGRG